MGTLPIFILVMLAVLFGILVMALTAVLGPKKPSPEKLAPYECGIQEIEAPHRRFPVKYLLTGMLFIVFDIEIVSFYPLAVMLRYNLKVLGLDGQPRPAVAADCTDIRWQLKNSLKANSVAFVRFRALVK